MFSPNLDPLNLKAHDAGNHFFPLATTSKQEKERTDADYLMTANRMNPPPKRGKYSRAAAGGDDDDDEEEEGTASAGGAGPREGWKQCDYVSNRTRLRCSNIRKQELLKEYGFCEEHQGYIERVRQEGLRTKHHFDPSFNFCQSFLDLISSDNDETLAPKRPEDFPFVYESVYCENRIDNDDNPLRRANVLTKKDIAKEYISALHRQDDSIQQMRIIYREKHRRILRQIASFDGKGRLTKLDPIKDAKKIQRLLSMRRYLLRNHGWERALEAKFETPEAMASASSNRREKWFKQLDSPIDEDEMEVQLAVSDVVNMVAESVDNGAQILNNMTTKQIRSLRRNCFMKPDEIVPALPKNIVEIMDLFRKHSKESKEEKLLATVKCQPILQQIQASEQQQSGSPKNIPPMSPPGPSSSASSLSVELTSRTKIHRIGGKMGSKNNSLIASSSGSQSAVYFPDGGLGVLRPSTSAAAVMNNDNNTIILNGGKNVRPVAIDEDICPDTFLQMTYPQLANEQQSITASQQQPKGQIRRGRKQAEEKDTEVCARINRPWNGKRNKGSTFVSKQQMSKLDDMAQNNHRHYGYEYDHHFPPLRSHSQISGAVPAMDGPPPPHQQYLLKKVPSAGSREPNNSFSSYQQYLSMQQLMPNSAGTASTSSAAAAIVSPSSQQNYQNTPQRVTRQVHYLNAGQHHQHGPMYGANYGSTNHHHQQPRRGVRGGRGGGVRRGAIARTIRMPPPPQLNNSNILSSSGDLSPPGKNTRMQQQHRALQHWNSSASSTSSSQTQNKFHHRC